MQRTFYSIQYTVVLYIAFIEGSAQFISKRYRYCASPGTSSVLSKGGTWPRHILTIGS